MPLECDVPPEFLDADMAIHGKIRTVKSNWRVGVENGFDSGHIWIHKDSKLVTGNDLALPLGFAPIEAGASTRNVEEEGGPKGVYDLLGDVPARVVPVGRLDLATSGLLLFTSDTQFANWLTDPANAVPRVYLVTVEGRVNDTAIASLERGISVDDERLAAHSATIRKASGKETHLALTLIEGRNREVRRLLEAVGHPVRALKRVQFGELTLGDLAPGNWRQISDAELRAAFPAYTAPRKRVPRPK